jgi:hypothetical protein
MKTNKHWVLAGALCLSACTATKKTIDDRALIASMTPTQWRDGGTWYFDVVDNDQNSIGHIVLLLTGDEVAENACLGNHWKNAIVLDNDLDYDFGFDIVPAYHVNGTLLAVELTASSCSVHHRFVGEATSEGASGSFHYLYSLNGDVVGAFTATTVVAK